MAWEIYRAGDTKFVMDQEAGTFSLIDAGSNVTRFEFPLLAVAIVGLVATMLILNVMSMPGTSGKIDRTFSK